MIYSWRDCGELIYVVVILILWYKIHIQKCNHEEQDGNMMNDKYIATKSTRIRQPPSIYFSNILQRRTNHTQIS